MRRQTRAILLLGIGVILTLLAIQLFRSDTSKGTVDLVIARYKEDLSWLKDYAHLPFRKIYIYSKSKEPIQCPRSSGCKIIQLPNVGVCDHTYLYHITTQYNNLADYTIFLPGSADLPKKASKTKKILESAFAFQPKIVGFTLDGPVDKLFDSFELTSWETSSSQNRDSNPIPFVLANPRPFGRWYRHQFPGNSVHRVSYFGMFAVSRETIHTTPKSVYQKCRNLLSKDTFSETAHYVERSWATFFADLPANAFISPNDP